MPTSRADNDEDELEEERRLMYVAITRARERLYLTRSKSRYLYGKREPTMRSRFLKELSSELELPRESRPRPLYGGSDDGYFADDDPEAYGNSAYGAGRYSGQGRGYNSSYGSSYGSYGDRQNSAPKRSAWNGGSSYGNQTYRSGSSSYGGGSYGNSSYGSAYGSSYAKKSTGAFTYGGVGSSAGKPKEGGKDLSAFRVGIKVSHPKFGDGTIVGVRGAGSNMILDIAFFSVGIKQLSAALAPLTVKNG